MPTASTIAPQFVAEADRPRLSDRRRLAEPRAVLRDSVHRRPRHRRVQRLLLRAQRIDLAFGRRVHPGRVRGQPTGELGVDAASASRGRRTCAPRAVTSCEACRAGQVVRQHPAPGTRDIEHARVFVVVHRAPLGVEALGRAPARPPACPAAPAAPSLAPSTVSRCGGSSAKRSAAPAHHDRDERAARSPSAPAPALQRRRDQPGAEHDVRQVIVGAERARGVAERDDARAAARRPPAPTCCGCQRAPPRQDHRRRHRRHADAPHDRVARQLGPRRRRRATSPSPAACCRRRSGCRTCCRTRGRACARRP